MTKALGMSMGPMGDAPTAAPCSEKVSGHDREIRSCAPAGRVNISSRIQRDGELRLHSLVWSRACPARKRRERELRAGRIDLADKAGRPLRKGQE